MDEVGVLSEFRCKIPKAAVFFTAAQRPDQITYENG
jgi:hypothetical protein